MRRRNVKLQLRVVSTVLACTFFGEQAFAVQALTSQKLYLDMASRAALPAESEAYLAIYLDLTELKAQAAIATRQAQSGDAVSVTARVGEQLRFTERSFQSALSQFAARAVRRIVALPRQASDVFAFRPSRQMTVLAKSAVEVQLAQIIQAGLGEHKTLREHTSHKLAQFIARQIMQAQGLEERLIPGLSGPTSDSAAVSGPVRTMPLPQQWRLSRKALHERLYWRTLPSEDLNPLHQFMSEQPETGPPSTLKRNTFSMHFMPLETSEYPFPPFFVQALQRGGRHAH